MLVQDDDLVVLGRRAGAPNGRWSTLAGYVEPRESLEAAVAREVLEEVGLEVQAVRYQGSRPWPFPASLMPAFRSRWRARPAAGQRRAPGGPLVYPSELANAIRTAQITTPGPISAGAFLLRRWLGTALAD
jgi:NAD+ diphosphatase